MIWTPKQYLAECARVPCAVCFAWPVHVHHCIMGRFSQSRSSDFDVIPLCPMHHTGLNPDNPAIHEERALWEQRFGKDTDYIAYTRRATLGPMAPLYVLNADGNFAPASPLTTET